MPMSRPSHHRHARPVPRFGETLRCPECWHFTGVGELTDGRKLRCTACGREVILARDYDAHSGEQRWELHSPDEEYEDDERR